MTGKRRITKEKTFGLNEHRHVLCSRCKSIITSPDTIVSVDGEHLHSFTNPAGITYTIGCYASAEGCIISGIPSLENTWFDGFFWNYALCLECFTHMGWHYQSESEHFFGLILEHLTVTQ